MEMLANPAVLLFITVTVYWLTTVARARTGNMLFNPVVLTSLTMVVYLLSFDIDYGTFYKAGQVIDFWLKPAVVSLAVPLYTNWKKIRSQWLPILVSQIAGCLTGILTSVYCAKWLGAGHEVIISLAAKSVTSPIAIEITKTIHGIPALTAASVILAGLIGQSVGFRLLRGSTITAPSSQSISIGTASHAMGISAAMERSSKFAAYASLGLIINGVLTAILVPLLIPLMGV